MSAPPIADQAQRDLVATALDRTLFVDAGAGSGKTKALVDRVAALVCDAGEPLEAIAAITFTEKAAAELRDRIRHELERRHVDPSRSDVQRQRALDALDQVDRSAIGTLHSFAQRILTEHAITAGLPPNIEVVDELASGIAFDRRWRHFVRRLLSDPRLETHLDILLDAEVRITALEGVAQAFNHNWDLLDRVDRTPPPPDLGWLSHTLDHLVAITNPEAPHFGVADGKFAEKVAERHQQTIALREVLVEHGPVPALAELRKLKILPLNVGRGAQKEVREAVNTDIEAAIDRAGEAVSDAILGIAAPLAEFTEAGVAQRRRLGQLEFHDLLVEARRMLTTEPGGPEIRRALNQRYRRILLDEFQDTDPIQLELALLIADPDTDYRSREWTALRPAPGRLFLVGDPKQSIYRFRRADVATYLAARDHLGGRDTVSLTTNFRSTGPLLDWINATFGQLITQNPTSQPAYERLESVRPGAPTGPAVLTLGGRLVNEKGKGATADTVRDHEAKAVADVIRRAMAEGWSVADTASDGAHAPAETGADTPTASSGGWRPARLSDICVLIPTRTSLAAIEGALADAGLPFRTDSASLAYASEDVRGLMAALRSIDDPTDRLSLLSALRSPLFGCGDDDLARHVAHHGGVLDLRAPTPTAAPTDDPVAESLAYLRELHRQRWWLQPATILNRLITDRRLMEVATFASPRTRDAWRRLRFVTDQARAWAESGDGSLRSYLAWVSRQAGPGGRVAEAVLPETDLDAVRIMTIHASKGLQFPICVVAGTSTRPSPQLRGVNVVWPGTSVGYRLGANAGTTVFDAHRELDEQMSTDERLRLLYVACTRAEDHLVVTTYHPLPSTPDSRASSRWSLAEVLWRLGPGSTPDDDDDASGGAQGTWDGVASYESQPDVPSTEAGLDNTNAPGRSRPDEGEPSMSWTDWRAEHERLRTRVRVRSSISATAIATAAAPRFTAVSPRVPDDQVDGSTPTADPGLLKQGRDLDLPPWQRGRYGTAVGRAVHGALQTVSLDIADKPGSLTTAAGRELTAVAAAQAAAEGVAHLTAEVEALAASALTHPLIRRAALKPHWRELYVAAPLDPSGSGATPLVLEGYLDLVFRDDAGLVIVDYKTDAIDRTAQGDPFASKVERYRLQAAAYALALGAILDEPICRCDFLFLHPDGAEVRSVTDLDEAMVEAREVAVALSESGRFAEPDTPTAS